MVKSAVAICNKIPLCTWYREGLTDELQHMLDLGDTVICMTNRSTSLSSMKPTWSIISTSSITMTTTTSTSSSASTSTTGTGHNSSCKRRRTITTSHSSWGNDGGSYSWRCCIPRWLPLVHMSCKINDTLSSTIPTWPYGDLCWIILDEYWQNQISAKADII